MSNMYPWIYMTHNPLAGRCQHGCLYCFVQDLKERNESNRAKYSGLARLALNWDKFPRTDKHNPDHKPIFMSSCNDLFGKWVGEDAIRQILAKCCQYPDLTYLFQTKDTYRMADFADCLPPKCIIGTTLETSHGITEHLSLAPQPVERFQGLLSVGLTSLTQEKMISIEPIMRMNVDRMIAWIRTIGPKFVSIGGDSGNHNLPEPSPAEIQRLVDGLSFTEVRLKANLRRLIDDGQT